MRTWSIVAFILFAVASGLAAIGRAWVLALIAAGIAVTLIPVVFNITS